MTDKAFEKTEHGWTVVDAARGVWSITYEFTPQAWANCVAIRLAHGGVLVLSPASNVSAGALKDLRSLGPVCALVATNGFHHLGLKEWREKFPEAKCFAPQAAMARIAKKNPQAGALLPLTELQPLLGSDVIIREAPRTKCGEMWAIVKPSESDPGAIFFASDILANIPALPQKRLIRLMFKLFRSAPGYRVFHLGLAFIVKDKRAVLSQVLEDLKSFPPSVVVPAHGLPVADGDVAQRTSQLVQAAL